MKTTELFELLQKAALYNRAEVIYTLYRDYDNNYILGGYRKRTNEPLSDTVFETEWELQRYIINLIDFWNRKEN